MASFGSETQLSDGIIKHRQDLAPGERGASISGSQVATLLRRDEASFARVVLSLFERLGGPTSGMPTDHANVQHALRFVSEACDRGILVLTRNPPGAPARSPAQKEPPAPADAPPRPRPRPRPIVSATLHFFAARWVDDAGQAIVGADLEFDRAGAKEQVTTNGSGVGRIDDVPETAATVKLLKPSSLRKLLKPHWDKVRETVPQLEQYGATIVPLAGQLPLYDLQADKVRLFSVQPYVARARLMGSFFDTSKSFLLPTAVDGVRGAVAMYEEMPDVALLVVGHTDTAGKPSYNDTLSVERATAIQDYLRGNVQGWTPWYEKSVASEKRWGSKEDRHMAMAMPDFDQKPRREPVMTWYRRTRKLEKASIEDIRSKLIGEYMQLEGTSIPAAVPITAHGCGENFPIDNRGDGVDDADNRRVEVFFFDRELGVQPPPPGQNSGPGSTIEPEWVRRAVRTESFPAPDPGMLLRLQIHDDEYRPMGDMRCELLLADGDVLEETTDPDGWIETEVPRAKQRIGVSYEATSDKDSHSYDVHVIPPDSPEEDRYMNHIHNFGFAPAEDGDETTALLFFQLSCKNISLTGQLDDATKRTVDDILKKTMLDQLEVRSLE